MGRLLFSLLVMYNVLYDGYVFCGALRDGESKKMQLYESSGDEKMTIADRVIAVFSWACLLGVMLFTVWCTSVPRPLLILLVFAPTCFWHMYKMVEASESLKNIIWGGNGNHDLTIKEKMDFDIFVGTFMAFSVCIPSERIVLMVEDLSNSQLSVEIVLSLYYLIFAFFITFIIAVELIIPVRHVRKGLEVFAEWIKPHHKDFSVYLQFVYDKMVPKARLTNRCMLSTPKNKKEKILNGFNLVIAITLDSFIGLVSVLYCYVVSVYLEIVVKLITVLVRGVLKMIRAATEIPGQRVMKNAFRISGIISIVFLVVINRYSVFYDVEDMFVGITEFVASAVILPIVFEWIYSSKKTA